MPRHPEVTCT